MREILFRGKRIDNNRLIYAQFAYNRAVLHFYRRRHEITLTDNKTR